MANSVGHSMAHCPGSRLAFGFGGYVAFGELGACTEKELFHLLFHDFLGIGVERVEAVFVHDHFGMFDPELPSVLGYALEDALADVTLPGHAIEARQVFTKFDAVNQAGAGFYGFARRWCWTAIVVGHDASLGISFSDTGGEDASLMGFCRWGGKKACSRRGIETVLGFAALLVA